MSPPHGPAGTWLLNVEVAVPEDITETWSVEICGHTISTSRIIHVSPAPVAYFVNVPSISRYRVVAYPPSRRLDYTNGQTSTLYD